MTASKPCNCSDHIEQNSVPYIVHESAMARMERYNRRILIALIVSILIIAITNCVWIYAMLQYDFESYEYTQDGEGVNVIGDSNGIDYVTNGKTQNEEEEEWQKQGEGDT